MSRSGARTHASVLAQRNGVRSTLRGPLSLSRQFYIGASAPSSPELTKRATIGNLSMYVGRDLPVLPIKDFAGSRIGFFLGFVVDIDRQCILEASQETGLDPRDPGFTSTLETHLYRHAGSWLFVLDTAGHRRVYLDADGTLSAVYEPDGSAVASTASALLGADQYHERFRHDLFNSLDVAHEGWFPAGLTAHRGIRRLLCNHYLDLDGWTAHRHWPVDDVRPGRSVTEAADRIAEICARTCRAVLPLDPVCSLTGGNETRFLLATMREFRDQVTFITVDGPTTRRDVVLARRLAEQFGLRHLELPVRWASPEQQGQWLRQAGHAIGGSNVGTHPTLWGLEQDHHVQLGGLGGEIGRGFLWRVSDDADMDLEAHDLVPRLGLPSTPEVIEATTAWFDGVAGLNPLLQLDLAYLELRMSAWAFAQSYANWHGLPLIHPMITREAYQLMLSVAPEARREGRFIRAGIRDRWPELLDTPINRYGDVRDALHWLSRASNPRRIVKKIRKRYG